MMSTSLTIAVVAAHLDDEATGMGGTLLNLEMRARPHARSYEDRAALSNIRGAEILTKHAEAVYMIREYIE